MSDSFLTMNKNAIHVVPVHSSSQKRDFIKLPWLLHANDPNWIAPLRRTVKRNLNVKKHPFYQHAELALWLAYKNGQLVGRIAGIIDHKYNEFHQTQGAFWGFFETEHCLEITTALLAAVEHWAKEKKAVFLRGPMNPSINYECGMQISAFDTKPFLMMPQNPSFYPTLIEAAGHSKVMDMYAWLIRRKTVNLNKRLHAIQQKLAQDENIVLRNFNMANYAQEIEIFVSIYNDAWQQNWGFVPMTTAETHYLAQELKSIIVPELTYFVMVNGEPAACAICLPNINQVLEKIPNGKLFPTGLMKLFTYLKVNKRNRQGRIPLLGVRKKFRHLQLGVLLYEKYTEVCPALDMSTVECSWILETNKPMNFGLSKVNAEHYKSYRIYEKLI
ncbi:hypothetical protein [Legionella pneumophila]|uniref:hypothetical protein n=1 Tax=Legionella pneumophila TaxID=446 RepID=UPI000778354F|nr:hypothetical protein [Legionella pneumophila]HAT8606374.1 hypothetical protein [Legionella pneumophila]